jgi:deoxyhypusine synthase
METDDIAIAKEAVFAKSSLHNSEFKATEVCGYDFNLGIDYEKILDSYLTTGFQATHLAKAICVSFFNKGMVVLICKLRK